MGEKKKIRTIIFFVISLLCSPPVRKLGRFTHFPRKSTTRGHISARFVPKLKFLSVVQTSGRARVRRARDFNLASMQPPPLPPPGVKLFKLAGPVETVCIALFSLLRFEISSRKQVFFSSMELNRRFDGKAQRLHTIGRSGSARSRRR